MNALYDAGIALYATAARTLGALREGKARQMTRGQRESIEKIRKARERDAPEGFDLWVHAASLGEFEQGRPLIEWLKRERPEAKVLLTFFSPSGYEVRKDWGGADCVAYLPFDTRKNARRVVEAAAAKRAVFVKYEFWGNYIEALKAAGTPTYLISAIFRPGQAFFKPWGGMMRRILRGYTHIYVQDERSAALLRGIGVENAEVAGDTRFDRVAEVRRSARRVEALERALEGSTLTLVAGSTWEPDEKIVAAWLKRHPEARAVVAPHEIGEERLRSIERLMEEARTVRLSRLQASGDADAAPRVVIVDCFGLLSSLYHYGDIAYVGGGYGAGIHNVNEAAAHGVATVFGPRHEKFKEAADLMALGGGFDRPEEALEMLAADGEARRRAGEAAGRYISENVGATERIYSGLWGSGKLD